ncbi:MAG: histidine phosphatase family protein, partial [Rhizobiaceae bacterium]
MLLYVIRHGQTDWNAEGRLQGQKDIPLNDTGRLQATGNGEALKELLGDDVADFDFVASPLSRTRETMERLRTAMGLDPLAYRTDDRLVEVSFGDWEGQTLAEVKKLEPELLKERKRQKW